MKALRTPAFVMGPYNQISQQELGFLADALFIPFTVVGLDCVVEEWVPPPPVITVEVPQIIPIRQACQALLEAGLLDDVEAIVATLPRQYQIDWERASEVHRDNPLVEIVRQQKSMTSAEIDSLFIKAVDL